MHGSKRETFDKLHNNQISTLCHTKPLANGKGIGKILPSLWDENDINRNLEAQFVKLHEQKCIPPFPPHPEYVRVLWGTFHQVIMKAVMHLSKHWQIPSVKVTFTW